MARPARRILLIVVGLLAAVPLCLICFLAYGLAGVIAPQYVGPHRRFYATCLAIRPGQSLAEARRSLSPYLEVGRTWQPPASFPPGLFQATVANITESRQEHASRLVFIPDAKNSADWCLVYPDAGGTVLRVAVSPD